MQDKVMQAIRDHKKIVLLRHISPDADAHGSQCGLAESIKQTFPSKSVYVYGSEAKRLREFYPLDDAKKKHYDGSLVIVLDTPISDRIEEGEHLDIASQIIKIDHHPLVEEFADIEWVDTTASSTCEMIADLIFNSELVVNETVGNLLYFGMIQDTGRFLYNSTTPKTYRIAAQLFEAGYDRDFVHEVSYTNNENAVRYSGVIMSNFVRVGNAAYYIAREEEYYDKYELSAGEISQFVSDFGKIKGIKIWALFIEDSKNGVWRTGLRSKEIVINELAEEFGGGGHKFASGVRLKSEERIKEFVSRMEQLAEEK